MSGSNPIERWSSWGPQLQSVLRIAAAIVFMMPGAMLVFAVPTGMPPGGTAAPPFSQMWIGGALEFFGGALLALGLFTRPVAFLLSGEMAVAYFQFHLPKGVLPTMNGGMAAALYCFVWLFFSAAGAGPWSLDARRGR